MEVLGKNILNILVWVGVNETVYYQLVIFPVGYMFLYFLVCKPYFRMLQEREKRTLGNQDLAGKIREETQQLESEYQIKARELSAQYKSIYDQCRTEAVREYDEIMNQARQRAKDRVEKKRQEIKQNVFEARKQLMGEKSHVAKAIVTQVLGEGG